MVDGTSAKLHGFCDAFESAYAGAVYLKVMDQDGFVQVSLVMANTKVALIKCLTKLRLELCAAVVVAKLLSDVAKILNIPTT